jgi:CIC family chloride channel protein
MRRASSRISLHVVLLAVATGITGALFAILLGKSTEYAENAVVHWSGRQWPSFIWLLPLAGLVTVYIVVSRFRSPLNGIREILDAIDARTNLFRPFRAVVHFITGWCTVVMGGSTGIEVSTVVAASSLGSWVGSLSPFHRRSLIQAGAASGIAGLFLSPLAGVCFVMEVLAPKMKWPTVIIIIISALASAVVAWALHAHHIAELNLHIWHLQALPGYLLLAGGSAVFSVLLTRCVVFIKPFMKLRLGAMGSVIVPALLIGLLVQLIRPLYGEGYSFINDLLLGDLQLKTGWWLLIAVMVFKPLATSLTLSAGGAGGVFAPSLVIGAVGGYVLAHSILLCGGVAIPANFVVAGMGAVLAASLKAPWTGATLAVSVTGSFGILLPVLGASLISSWLAHRILPYTVYTAPVNP